MGPETVKLLCQYEVMTCPIADGAVSSGLRCQPVVAALTAGEVARTAEPSLVLNQAAPGVVNALGVAAPARLFPLASRHTRMLSQEEGTEFSGFPESFT